LRKIYWATTLFIRYLMKIFAPYEIINKERLDTLGGKIIASNHVSNFDPPFIGSVLPLEIYFLAKSELFKNKIMGKILSTFNAIPIKRGKMDISAIKKCISVLNNGHSMLIFPQGTRNGKVAKPGIGMIALAVKKDIVPIRIENSTQHFSCLFRLKRVKIIIGETIMLSSYDNLADNKEKYQLISNDILEKIQGLNSFESEHRAS